LGGAESTYRSVHLRLPLHRKCWCDVNFDWYQDYHQNAAILNRLSQFFEDEHADSSGYQLKQSSKAFSQSGKGTAAKIQRSEAFDH
jgi:hypothetical protein